MLAALKQLLVLQDRDRKITDLHAELASLDPQRRGIEARAERLKAESEAARHQVFELETSRKKLELDVEAKKQQIARYSLQQYETKRNEEYRALAHEIELAQQAIRTTEDQELEIMEQIEAARVRAATAAETALQIRAEAEQQMADLSSRQANLNRELIKLQEERQELAAQIDETFLARYERLRRNKGTKVLVGIEHGVCGGCHMRLPAQILVTCQAQKEVTQCINCGRLLYYTRDMNLVISQ
jgi:uncharacterized protein